MCGSGRDPIDLMKVDRKVARAKCDSHNRFYQHVC
jgi:hypothetical protein